MHLIRVHPRFFELDNAEDYAWKGLYRRIDANPGAVWQIGNEPDGFVLEPSSDGLDPATYARVYKTFYDRIKARDASAQVTNGPIIQGSPIRLAWLTMVWDAYASQNDGEPMPVDIWNMHNQIVWERETGGAYIPQGCEQYPAGCAAFQALALDWQLNKQNVDDPAIFAKFVEDMRRWMKDHGQQGKSLIISEYGLMQPEYEGFTVDRVNQFMRASFTYLMYARDPQLGMPTDDHRLVQRWNWFSLNASPGELGVGGFNGNLFDPDSRQITEFGRSFSRLACAEHQPTPTPSTTPRPSWMTREAEGGSLHGSMATGQADGASDCRYVHVPAAASSGSQGSTLAQNTDATYHVYAPSTGEYILWMRGWGSDWDNYAYGVRVGEYPETVVRFDSFGHWDWGKVPQTYYLLGGRWHEVVLGPRGSGGARVDLFVLTADLEYTPLSHPELIAPCNPTPTLTPTATRTPMPGGVGRIVGSVDYQGRGGPSAAWETDLVVSAHLPDDPIPAYHFRVISRQNGDFGVPSGIQAGTYDVGVRDLHSLRNLRKGDAVTADTPRMDMGLLVEGDCNVDNAIDVSDLAILASSYGQTLGETGYDRRADLNDDGTIDISDLALLARNYGKAGDLVLTELPGK